MFDFDLERTLLSIPGILMGLVFHEFAHALTADKLGDRTPRYQGRLTLSPMVHLDPVGLILILFAGFGWAKPVQIDPRNLRHPRRDNALISLAGPVTNFIMAVFFAIILKILYSTNGFGLDYNIANNLVRIMGYAITINVYLGIFNLLPIPPLDGSHLLESYTNIERFEFYHTIRQYSMIILILIIATPVAGKVLTQPANFIISNILRLVGLA